MHTRVASPWPSHKAKAGPVSQPVPATLQTCASNSTAAPPQTARGQHAMPWHGGNMAAPDDAHVHPAPEHVAQQRATVEALLHAGAALASAREIR